MELSQSEYAIICSSKTAKLWRSVIDALISKHMELKPLLLEYTISFSELNSTLSKILPYYSAFIATPEECTREYIKSVLNFVRSYQPGPYFDTIYGIITGPNEEIALKIAQQNTPLQIKTAISNCPFPMQKCMTATMFSELRQFESVCKKCDSLEVSKSKCGTDIAKMLCESLNNKENKIDMIISSAHASEHDWRIGYTFKAGRLIHKKDQCELLAEDTEGKIHEINSENPKILIAAGNCLMGHITQDKPCMALSWMKSANIIQMIGYTVETWFGYGGWGVLKYFIEMCGLFSISQAYFANMQTMIYESENNGNADFVKGCKYDLQHVVFYGDPAYDARMLMPNEKCIQKHAYVIQKTLSNPNEMTIRVKTEIDGCWNCATGDDKRVNPGRPPFVIFEKRLKNPKIIKGDVILTSLFVMWILKGEFKKDEIYEAIIQFD